MFLTRDDIKYTYFWYVYKTILAFMIVLYLSIYLCVKYLFQN
jgi:hypothetical protein